MSSSYPGHGMSRDCYYRRRRRPRRSAIPAEIAANVTASSPLQQQQYAPQHSSRRSNKKTQCDKNAIHKTSSDDDAAHRRFWEASSSSSLRGVTIRPGHEWPSSSDPWLSPPEPPEPPPVLEHMLQFVLVGSPGAGKSSIVQEFVERRPCNSSSSSAPRQKRYSRQQPLLDATPPPRHQWSVEYVKKDVTFYASQSTRTGTCARVQLWDVAGGGPTTTISGNSFQQQQQLDRHKELQRSVMDKADAVILVTSLEQGAERMLQNVRAWKEWIHCYGGPYRVVLLVHKSDVLLQTNSSSSSSMLSPSVWLRLGCHVERTCQQVGIHAWHLTSCCSSSSSSIQHEEEDSVHRAMMSIIRDTVASTATATCSRMIGENASRRIIKATYKGGKSNVKTAIVEAKAVPI